MKLTVAVDGRNYLLTFERQPGGIFQYALEGAIRASGTAALAELMPGVYSILLGTRSIEARVAASREELEVRIGGRLHIVSIADARDRPSPSKRRRAHGPVELRSQMPGKIVKLLVQPGAVIQAGQGLIVVEAMKMQNEMKSPKDGVVSKIHVAEGTTVAAGESLLVVE